MNELGAVVAEVHVVAVRVLEREKAQPTRPSL
jgi:hypothetical protein